MYIPKIILLGWLFLIFLEKEIMLAVVSWNQHVFNNIILPRVNLIVVCSCSSLVLSASQYFIVEYSRIYLPFGLSPDFCF